MRTKKKSVRKLKRFSFVFSLIFENRTYYPHTSILTTNYFLVILKAKYQNVPSILNFWHMSHVLSSLLADTVNLYLVAFIKNHPVHVTSENKVKQIFCSSIHWPLTIFVICLNVFFLREGKKWKIQPQYFVRITPH